MPLVRFRRTLLVLAIPVAGTVLAMLGNWGASHTSVATPISAIVVLAYVAVLWRVSASRERTIFVAGVVVSILADAGTVAVLRLFSYEVGGLPVTVVLLQAVLLWCAVTLVEAIGRDLRLNRIGQVVALVAVLGAAAIALLLGDYQQLVLFLLFPISFFIVRRPEARLAVGFAFFGGLAIEMAGTALGAWAWAPGVLAWPTIGRGFANPPYGAGGLYALTMALAMILIPIMEPAVRGGQLDNQPARLPQEPAPRRRGRRPGTPPPQRETV